MEEKVKKEENPLTHDWINFENMPNEEYFATAWFLWINKKAKVIDVLLPAHDEYLKRELLSLHEKYNVPLNSPAFERMFVSMSRSWKRWIATRKFFGMGKDAHANIDLSREKVFYNAFFASFSRSYFNKRSLAGACYRLIDKGRRP